MLVRIGSTCQQKARRTSLPRRPGSRGAPQRDSDGTEMVRIPTSRGPQGDCSDLLGGIDPFNSVDRLARPLLAQFLLQGIDVLAVLGFDEPGDLVAGLALSNTIRYSKAVHRHALARRAGGDEVSRALEGSGEDARIRAGGPEL